MLIHPQSIDAYNPHILFVINEVITKDSNFHTRYHTHDFLELSIVTSGHIPYHIEGTVYLIEEGDVLIFNPNIHHPSFPTLTTYSTSLHIGISDLHIDCSQKKNFIQHKDISPILSMNKYKDELLSCCKEIEKEQRLRQLGHNFLLKSLVMKLIILLYREMDQDSIPLELNSISFESRDKQSIVQVIIDYMNTYYMEDISLDHISKNMFLSSVYISKIFKEETGTSPINYLIQIRLNKAKELLQSQSIPINLVAKSVGYSDAYYFSKLFKKYFGIAPSKIAKK